MFSSKKKVDKDKKKNAPGTVQVQMQQSSSTSVQTSSHSSSSSSFTINTSTTSTNNTDFPRLSLRDRPSFARGLEARASTTKDWKPFPSGGTSNKDNIKRRVAEWERRSGGSFENKAFPPPSTDALRMISNVPSPYRTAFGNTTTANYPNNFTPTNTSGLISSSPASVKRALPSTAKRDGEASQFLHSKVKIKVVKSGKVYYDPNSTVPTYNTTSKNKGKALIINNIVFQGESAERRGAEFDESNICELFKQMGFKVEKHRNKTEKDMRSLIENYRRNKGLEKCDINVVVIMSHGYGTKNNSTEIAAVDEKMISTAWITDQFNGNNCPSLKGKPKIFIFQCCRGDQMDIATDAAAVQSTLTTRTQADLLMAYSTIPGYVSHRDPNLGTWYIQAICKVFMEHAHNTDVENLLKIVDDQLANIARYESRQTSSYENRGFKMCFFHPM